MPLAIATPTLTLADEATMTNPGDIKWGDASPSLSKGAKLAVLHGDPGKPGSFAMRLKAPTGYKIAPHTHTQTENLTVISGALYLGMSEEADPDAAHPLKAGARRRPVRYQLPQPGRRPVEDGEQIGAAQGRCFVGLLNHRPIPASVP